MKEVPWFVRTADCHIREFLNREARVASPSVQYSFAGSGVLYLGLFSSPHIKRVKEHKSLHCDKSLLRKLSSHIHFEYLTIEFASTMETPPNQSADDKPSLTGVIENINDIDKMKETGESSDLDDALLQAQGHAAELERSFSWVGAVGLAFRFVDTLTKE